MKMNNTAQPTRQRRRINGTDGPWDKFWIGFLVNILLPFVVFAFTWEWMSGYDYDRIFHLMFEPVIKNYLILLMMPDLIVFFAGYKLDIFRFCGGAMLGFTPYMLLLIYLFCQ